ncbi:3'-5' exonuclease [Bradyrhizobium diazoefficiens]|uniref:3'-5' exonuclease n=1 Tax=Bradyrhizobium diazoefficiens TaxID=1355477 RepID=UPI000D73F3CB|nr:3'-5' exonuclease [Bradyrhizobium diazoefficiens]AWO87539.1 3'-5' exonuclease [Bradyrhizobium diazoefficiens]
MDQSELERMATLLEARGRYRILRRLEPRAVYDDPDGSVLHRGIFLDVETTGTDPSADEIIELAMVPFDFASDGRIFTVHGSFGRLRDPGRSIPPDVVALTGITDEMVAGQSIDPADVEAFVGSNSVVLVVAHHAGFDRAFAERFYGAFARLPWACSWREIPWADEGFADGTKLANLAAGYGFFHGGHRAVDDCRAGVELLSRRLPRSGRRALDVLLESARTPRWRIRATGAPFELREILKARRYRWDPGENGRPRAWFIDVTAEALDAERDFLRSEIYRREVDIDARRIDAYDRYSDRA